MTNTFWNSASDDWSNAADWTPGLPNPKRDAIINADGTYIVTISSAEKAHSLTIDNAGATLSENSGGSLTMRGGLTLDSGTVILNGANSFGGETTLVGGTLELGNAAALGKSNFIIDGGMLVGTTNEILSNRITASGVFTLAAAHGDTVKFTGQTILNSNVGGSIEFGQTGDDGIFVWDPVTLGVTDSGFGFSVGLNAGMLRDANGSLNEILSGAPSVSIAAGAKLDIHGHSETINNLSGGGIVTSGINGGALALNGGNFSGTVRGSLALTVGQSMTLSGTFAPKEGTTIDSSATLSLQDGGSIHGNIANDGVLAVVQTNQTASVLSGDISGSGSIRLDGGTLILDGSNTYSGGTTLSGGTLEAGSATALGTGTVDIQGTESFIGTATEALSNQLIIDGTTTFAAAHGTTLTLNTGAAWSSTSATTIFGSSTDDGVVVWDSPSGSNAGRGYITIAGGTLRAGDANFQALLTESIYGTDIPNFTEIKHGAALDVAGFASTIYYIKGNGTIENSGAPTTVTLEGGSFSGTISGPITLDVTYLDTTLSGAAANYGTINLIGTQLLLAGPSSSNIVFSGLGGELTFGDPPAFTGSITGFQKDDFMRFNGIGSPPFAVSYSGDTTGGILTVSSTKGTAHIHMIGDYTHGNFVSGGGVVEFVPQTSAASSHADAFDFSAVPATHIAPEASITHLHAGHDANEVVLTQDATEALHAHDSIFDHLMHGLLAHGHAGMAEALF